MIFPYKRLGTNRFEPIVPLSLKTPFRWMRVNVFVDSGADCSVFHSDIADILGLNLHRGKKEVLTVGDGDRMTVYIHQVQAKFAHHIFEASIAFSPMLGAGFNLLGRKTFFEKFRMCFNDREKTLTTTFLGREHQF